MNDYVMMKKEIIEAQCSYRAGLLSIIDSSRMGCDVCIESKPFFFNESRIGSDRCTGTGVPISPFPHSLTFQAEKLLEQRAYKVDRARAGDAKDSETDGPEKPPRGGEALWLGCSRSPAAVRLHHASFTGDFRGRRRRRGREKRARAVLEAARAGDAARRRAGRREREKR